MTELDTQKSPQAHSTHSSSLCRLRSALILIAANMALNKRLIWLAVTALVVGGVMSAAVPTKGKQQRLRLEVGPLSVRVVAGPDAAVAVGARDHVQVPAGVNPLHVARDHLRKLRSQLIPTFTGAVVSILPGVYGPLALDPTLDSGETPDASVVWQAAQAGTVAVSGGTPIPTSLFHPMASSSSVLVANISSVPGITTADLNTSFADVDCIHGCAGGKMELFFNAKRQTTARYPSVSPQGQWMYAHAKGGGAGEFTIDAKADPETAKHVLSWKDQDDIWVHGYWEHDWADCYRRVESVAQSLDTVTVTFKGTETVKKNARFYGVNALSELDSPGEYLIKSDGTLYFYPPLPLSQWTQDPVVSTNVFAINATGMQHVTFSGINVTYSREIGLLAPNVNDVQVVNCVVHGHGQDGIQLIGANSAVTSSHVYSTGCAGIRVIGGDIFTLTPGNMSATENTIHDFAQFTRTYQPGIYWGGVNNVYSHNDVSNGPHNCFLGGGNEQDAVGCLFEYNTLDTCGFESADTGAFYTCGQMATAWVNRGHHLRHSVFRNVRNIGSLGVQGPSLQAIYLDDQMSGWEIYNNTFINCMTGTFSGGGRRNKFYNNYYQDVDTCHHFDNRGMNWQLSSCNCSCGSAGCAPKQHASCDPGAVQYMLKSPAGATYASEWPELLTVATDKPCVPVENLVANNTYCNITRFTDASSSSIAAWNSTYSNNEQVPCRFEGTGAPRPLLAESNIQLEQINQLNQARNHSR
eukprot:m.17437 g.17437  ORF g.17437 m.17437 type:complete len:750 (-) comp5452_c0_seq2:173-2422(-)